MGFLVKDTEPAELLQAVGIVAWGDALLSPGITQRLIADIVRDRTGHTGRPLNIRPLGPAELRPTLVYLCASLTLFRRSS